MIAAAIVGALLAHSTGLAVAPQTVTWDLTVELTTDDDPPDQVCLVTPVNPEALGGFWFPGVELDVLQKRGVLVRDDATGQLAFERESALRSGWFDGQLTDEQEPVRDAFEALRSTPGDPDACSTREPAGCEPAWEFTPPKVDPDWPWVVMCSPNRSRTADARVAFVTVRGVDLDLAFTPYVIAFDVFGDAVQIRFDSVRTKRELGAANFQASVGIAGGDYHRVAAAPSFRGRVRLPLQPRCRMQSFRLPEGLARDAKSLRSVFLDEHSHGEQMCSAHRLESNGSCALTAHDIHRGIFETRVPMAVHGKRHHLEAIVRSASDATAPPVCASATWSALDSPEIVPLQPEQIALRWRWPCFAETSAKLQCPAARVVRGGPCQVTSESGSNTCEYRCPARRGDAQSVGWPVEVELSHDALGMHWQYELDALQSERDGTFAAADRRFLVQRGLRTRSPDATERWPAWWTKRHGDEIQGATMYPGTGEVHVHNVGTPDPVVGTVSLPGPDCRENIQFRYISGDATSRHYNRRDIEATWPIVELPAPDRSAFPLLMSAEVGGAITVDPTEAATAYPQVAVAVNAQYRGFWRHDRHAKRSAWLLGARYFAMFGAKEYLRTVGRQVDGDETLATAQHGIAVRYGMRFDRYQNVVSRVGFAINAGVGWTTPLSRSAAERVLPDYARAPFVVVSPEAVFHYSWFRASLSLGVLGPSPSKHRLNASGTLDTSNRTRDRYGRGAWFLVPGFALAAEF